MKRLCIYVVYDIQQKINLYIQEVLREIKKYSTDIIVVCNFEKIFSGEEYLKPDAKEILCRKNKGLDAGAYKDVMMNLLSREYLESFDELILANDTFFAPIFSFYEMFDVMTNYSCDFWGITENSKGFSEIIGEYNSHIQSYFIVLKRSALQSDAFRKFWEEYEPSDDKNETIKNFEIGINRCLENAGLRGISYLRVTNKYDIDESENTNFYNKYAYELLHYLHIPIIKKANFQGKNQYLINSIKALRYIKESTEYDERLITSYIEEYQCKGLFGPYFDFKQLGIFVSKYNRIYVYGAGVWGNNIKDYFELMGWSIEAFLVTDLADKKIMIRDAKLFSDVKIAKTDGVIIAQEKEEVCNIIKQYIGEYVGMEQIFTPKYPK